MVYRALATLLLLVTIMAATNRPIPIPKDPPRPCLGCRGLN